MNQEGFWWVIISLISWEEGREISKGVWAFTDYKHLNLHAENVSKLHYASHEAVVFIEFAIPKAHSDSIEAHLDC